MTDDISIGGELAFTGTQHFDGDPSNLNTKLPAMVVVNLQLFGAVNNLFDNRDALYGTYFDPSDTRDSLRRAWPTHVPPHRKGCSGTSPTSRYRRAGAELYWRQVAPAFIWAPCSALPTSSCRSTTARRR